MKTKITRTLCINTKSCLTDLNRFEMLATEHFYAPYDLKNNRDAFKNKKPTIKEMIFINSCKDLASVLSNIALIDRHGIAYNRYGRTCYDIVIEFSYSTMVFELVYVKRSDKKSLRLYATPDIMRQFIDYVKEHNDILDDYINIEEREERSNA